VIGTPAGTLLSGPGSGTDDYTLGAMIANELGLSVMVAAGIGLTGVVFGAVAGVTAQLTEQVRAATGSALAVLGAAVLVRGVGDVVRPGGSPLSWFSPVAWAQQNRALVDVRWTPLLLSGALLGALVAGAPRLAGRRDVGAGLLPPRRGPAGASALLSGPTGLLTRLQRGTVVGWAWRCCCSGSPSGRSPTR
jgi:ABC-2 type transport system permease protein